MTKGMPTNALEMLMFLIEGSGRVIDRRTLASGNIENSIT
jgi:hypothetical protein